MREDKLPRGYYLHKKYSGISYARIRYTLKEI